MKVGTIKGYFENPLLISRRYLAYNECYISVRCGLGVKFSFIENLLVVTFSVFVCLEIYLFHFHF